MAKLEIITNAEDPPPDVAFDWFPGLHQRYVGDFFRIYACELKQPLSKYFIEKLGEWRERDEIVYWRCE